MWCDKTCFKNIANKTTLSHFDDVTKEWMVIILLNWVPISCYTVLNLQLVVETPFKRLDSKVILHYGLKQGWGLCIQKFVWRTSTISQNVCLLAPWRVISKFQLRCKIKTDSKWNWILNDLSGTVSGPFLPHVVYLSHNWDCDGNFELLNRSCLWLLHNLWHKAKIFSFCYLVQKQTLGSFTFFAFLCFLS